MHHQGFTIVELLVVLVIVSMLSATALLTVRLPLRQAELELAMEQIRSLDSLARAHSSRGGTAKLRVLVAQTQIVLTASNGRLISSLQLPRQARLLRVFVLNQDVSKTAIELQYTNRSSPTFGLIVGSQGTLGRWLIVCGLSGESYLLNREVGDGFIASLAAQSRHFAH